jgi:hypothetical protein
MKVKMEEMKPVKGLAVYHAGRRAALIVSKMVQYQRYLSEDSSNPMRDKNRRKSSAKSPQTLADTRQLEESLSALSATADHK